MGVLLVSVPFDIKHFPPLPIPRVILFSFQAATPKTVDETPQERPSRSLEDVDSFWTAKEKYLLSFKLYLADHTEQFTSNINILAEILPHILSFSRHGGALVSAEVNCTRLQKFLTVEYSPFPPSTLMPICSRTQRAAGRTESYYKWRVFHLWKHVNSEATTV